MKPDWDKLMKEYKDNKTKLIADIDCTAAGKPLCDSHGIQGFPTLKYGDPSDLQDYKGGRDYKALSKFAESKLKPMCSPKNIDLCDDDKKAEIEKYQTMDTKTLELQVFEKEAAIQTAEEEFQEFVESLQKQYSDANFKKDKVVQDIKDSGLGLMKAVLATKPSTKKEEDDASADEL